MAELPALKRIVIEGSLLESSVRRYREKFSSVTACGSNPTLREKKLFIEARKPFSFNDKMDALPEKRGHQDSNLEVGIWNPTV